MLKLKKGDQIRVVAGKDKGKTGEVTKVLRKENAVVVAGVNLYKKHVKATQNREGGLVSMERPLNMGKVVLLVDGKPSRVGFSVTGKDKTRVSKQSGKKI